MLWKTKLGTWFEWKNKFTNLKDVERSFLGVIKCFWFSVNTSKFGLICTLKIAMTSISLRFLFISINSPHLLIFPYIPLVSSLSSNYMCYLSNYESVSTIMQLVSSIYSPFLSFRGWLEQLEVDQQGLKIPRRIPSNSWMFSLNKFPNCK